MITKNILWKLVCQELKDSSRSRKLTLELIEKIKDIPQDEDKD